jgi:hypothetical protein
MIHLLATVGNHRSPQPGTSRIRPCPTSSQGELRFALAGRLGVHVWTLGSGKSPGAELAASFHAMTGAAEATAHRKLGRPHIILGRRVHFVAWPFSKIRLTDSVGNSIFGKCQFSQKKLGGFWRGLWVLPGESLAAGTNRSIPGLPERCGKPPEVSQDLDHLSERRREADQHGRLPGANRKDAI